MARNLSGGVHGTSESVALAKQLTEISAPDSFENVVDGLLHIADLALELLQVAVVQPLHKYTFTTPSGWQQLGPAPDTPRGCAMSLAVTAST